MVDLSLNQMLMRSVNTSLVVLLPILSLLLFGGDTLKDFAFAMFIGVAIGAYSSIFIAAPVLTILKGREQRYADRGPSPVGARRRRPPGAPRRPATPPWRRRRAGDAAASRATAQGPQARPRRAEGPPAKRKRR